MNMYFETITPRINPQWESFPRMYILGKIPQGLPTTSLRCGVLRPTRILTLDHLPAPIPWTAYCLRLTPVSHHTVTSTKLLILFYSPTESLRPVTSSSAWNQDQQHRDDFPASWLTGYFSLHIHTLFPVSCLLVTGHVLSGRVWFLKA